MTNLTPESKFWITIFALISVIVVTLTLSITAYWTHHNAQIVKLVVSGTPAVEAMCALQNDYGRMPVCLVIATKQ